MILLDTSYIILLARGSPRAEKVLDLADKEGVALTSISYFEIFRSRRRMGRSEFRYFTHLFSVYPVLSLDITAADEASRIQYMLEKAGRPVNILDVLIAGIMKANGIDKIATSDKDFLEIAKIVDIDVLMV